MENQIIKLSTFFQKERLGSLLVHFGLVLSSLDLFLFKNTLLGYVAFIVIIIGALLDYRELDNIQKNQALLTGLSVFLGAVIFGMSLYFYYCGV